MQKAKVSVLDVEELACYITGLDYDAIDADTATIDEKLQDEFGCDIDQFTDIISRLLPLTTVAESPLTQKVYKGFADDSKQMWLVKTEVVN